MNSWLSMIISWLIFTVFPQESLFVQLFELVILSIFPFATEYTIDPKSTPAVVLFKSTPLWFLPFTTPKAYSSPNDIWVFSGISTGKLSPETSVLSIAPTQLLT